MMSRAHCFAPIEDTTAMALILGSMPGKASLAAGEYYAHPRNIFWPIMGELVGAHPGLPYEGRLRMLKSSGIALWDVLHSCIRKGSLDSDIEEVSAVPNDFESFFLRHPDITRVFFNGAKAEQCFLRHVQPSLTSHSLQYQRLPSTSPANAGTPYGKKLDAWRAAIQPGLKPRFQRTTSCRCRTGALRGK
jgi:TDG/mug DNA glycosylase family protein